MTNKTTSAIDLVERLRGAAATHAECGTAWRQDTLEWQAADTITRLQAALDTLARELTIQRNDLLARGYSPSDDEVARIDEALRSSVGGE